MKDMQVCNWNGLIPRTGNMKLKAPYGYGYVIPSMHCSFQWTDNTAKLNTFCVWLYVIFPDFLLGHEWIYISHSQCVECTRVTRDTVIDDCCLAVIIVKINHRSWLNHFYTQGGFKSTTHRFRRVFWLVWATSEWK